MLLLTVSVPAEVGDAAAVASAELPERVQLVTVSVPPTLEMPPPNVGGVAGEGAAGDRQRAVVVDAAAADTLAELPERVQSVTVSVPVVVDAAAVVGGGVAGEGAVGDRQRARR